MGITTLMWTDLIPEVRSLRHPAEETDFDDARETFQFSQKLSERARQPPLQRQYTQNVPRSGDASAPLERWRRR